MTKPILFWFRRDLRVLDHPGFHAACATGRPVIPVFIKDTQVDALGAAPKFRLGLGVEAFASALDQHNSRLILRSGDALEQIRELIAETGADSVWWTRAYDPAAINRDGVIKAALKEEGIDARSFAGHLLFEPWTVETKTGGFYKVYSPFWRAVRGLDVAEPLPVPSTLPTPVEWPNSEKLGDWHMSKTMNRGAAIVRSHQRAGSTAALDRLDQFLSERVHDYKAKRDFPAAEATSNLSEYLSLGEISPRVIWHRGQEAMRTGAAGAEHFLKEVVWREFAYHLMYHSPHILSENWRENWGSFPWSEDPQTPEFVAWTQGRTGIPLVDAAMREMYVTGRMHNRARMIAASYLTKHLLTHWKLGMEWFEDCLTDWDPAANAMGWQWVAGCGPDAAPYFRIFNPATQREKFDAKGTYVLHWLAESQLNPPETALSYFEAIPRSWNLSPSAPYPTPVVALDEGRKRALAAYEQTVF